MFEKKTVGVEDLSWLREISDKSVVENLKKRFEKDIIYTAIKSSICVCVNPFKNIPNLYSEETFYKYRDASPVGSPTHLYTFAEQMWSGISNHNNDQAIIFCGESGSGKTVNARHTIEYLRRAATSNKSKESMKKDEILQTFQDLLESFGNARTERNYNSSRFGKILELTINGQNQIVGSKITPIMLEKSRLTNLPPKDRNFHIFYGMMKSKEKYTKHLNMKSFEHYNYLKHGTETAPNWDDAEQFSLVIKALKSLSFSDEIITSFFTVVHAILLLGNIEFTEVSAMEAKVANIDVLNRCADDLGIDRNELQLNLTQTTLEAGATSIKKVYNKVQCYTERDNIAKKLYNDIFDWIIAILNEELKGDGQKVVIILDIFGFENFRENSLEQFFINYANECLQGLFTTNTMKREEELYKREGIPWENVKYSDNIDIIKLIENNLLPTLGDTCMKTHAIRDGSGRAFAQDIAGFNGSIMTSDMNQMSIKHYTVKVSYRLEDFVNKNREGIRKPITDMLGNSKNSIVKQVSDLSGSNNSNSDPKKAMSSKRIRNDTDYIREKFANCDLTYVRCIKSTNELKGDTFDETLVAKQVQDLGLPPTALVFSKTFVLHAPFPVFARRYALLVGEKLPPQQKAGDSGKFKDICERIMKVVVKGGSKEYMIGKTEIFVRSVETNESLLDAKMVKLNQLVTSIQTELRKLNVIVDETSENQKLAELLRSKERHSGIFEVPEIHPKLVSLETIGDCSKHLKRKEKVLGTFLLKKYPRTFKENKCSFWWLVVTNIGALMFRKRVSKDNSIQTELVARLTANDIVSIEVSCLRDRFCLFKFEAGLKIEPLLFHINFLPNLLWILGDKHMMQSKIMFSNELNYELKALKGFVGSIANKLGGLSMQLKFTKAGPGADSAQGAEGTVKSINASSKSTQIQVTGGIAAGSQPKPVKVKRN